MEQNNPKITLSKINDVYLKIEGDPAILVQLHHYFTFDIPNASYHPLVRKKRWDGKIRLLNLKTSQIYFGLKSKIIEICKENGYEIELDQSIKDDNQIDPIQLVEFVKSLNLHSNGKSIDMRSYQFLSLSKMLEKERSLIVSPTGSGKSLIIYAAMRAYIEGGLKGILIVPTQGLVEQMYNDFKDYSSQNKWNVDKHIQKLYSGYDKTFNKSLLITTWQSLLNMPVEFYEQFNFMIGDECHQWDSKSFETIGKRFVKTGLRTGFTGTLEDSKAHKMVLEGIFGPIFYSETTSQLIEQGYLAKTEIKCLVFKHPENICEIICNSDYQHEIQYLTGNEKRNKFIAKLATSLKGNTLVLFNYVENQGLILNDMLLELAPDRVFLIHGEVETDIREQIRKVVNTSNDAILLASLGTFSVGQNIPNLHNGIFAHPSKSKIRNLQSIGRGLRKGNNKESFVLYDIADDMRYQSKYNYTLKHFMERIRIYNNEKFNYKVYNLNL